MERIRADLVVEEEMTRLKERHTEIERRLAELERHISLTSDEQRERVELKKEKLAERSKRDPGAAAEARRQMKRPAVELARGRRR